MSNPRIPSAVYRLQLNASMRFDDARVVVPYLHELGISDLYSSPILQARRGSNHGYDITDPTRINSELGSEEDFENLCRQLLAHGMGVLLDIVPNHLAASSENPWWMDLLQDGPASIYAPYFDVDWHPPSRSLDNRILLPILGRPYAEVLENRELTLEFDHGSFYIRYFDTRLPMAPRPYRFILEHRLDRLREKLGLESPEMQELEGIRSELDRLPGRSVLLAEKAAERRLQLAAVKERLARLYSASPDVREFINQNVRIFNGRRGVSESFTHLDRLLSLQCYVLAYWRNTNQGINYRRFFTIMDLVGVRVEDPVTFDATHAVILRLASKGLITGLRIDHIDGLRDPEGYVRRLQARLGEKSSGNGSSSPALNGKASIVKVPFYIVIEKILGADEPLPDDWPIYGTTGYDFLNKMNGLFLDISNAEELDRIYHSFSDLDVPYQDLPYEKKKQVMENLLAVEMYSLGRQLALLAEQDRYARELPRSCLTSALVETTACFPIYRTYIRGMQPGKLEKEYIAKAIDEAQRRNPALGRACFEFVRQVLLLEFGPLVLPEQREARLNFVMRWQQFTGPIMAKAFEDSLLYVYNRLVSLNEVGGEPNVAGCSVAEFHRFGVERQKLWPHTLNATTTHDTKRAEDVRARINVLSELPKEWEERLHRWHELNQIHRTPVNGRPVPTANEEILLYQTMLGAWPLEDRELAGFAPRLESYMIKAIREAMVHTKWTVPNVAHEDAVKHFIAAILQPVAENHFLQDFLEFFPKVAFFGALNGLAQTLIKITFPGVPDVYQGSDLWDFRLVDPDNRGPVDFTHRIDLLESLRDSRTHDAGLIADLLDRWCDGRIKLYVLSRALCFRKSHAELFSNGAYLGLKVTGALADHVCAFARRHQDSWAMTIVPRLASRLIPLGTFPLGEAWRDTAIQLPRNAPVQWRNTLDGNAILRYGGRPGGNLLVREILDHFPLALLGPA
jgi:(1->4)-alpha-D-glucan 1-alpha-D-glucosylmutase